MNSRGMVMLLLVIYLPLLSCGTGNQEDQLDKAEVKPPNFDDALAVLEDDGVVIAAPGMEPQLIAKAGHETLLALGGDVVVVHPYEGGVPLPAESESVVVSSAGPAIIPRDEGFVVSWVVGLSPRDEARTLMEFTRVVVEDISEETPKAVTDGPPKREGVDLLAISEEIPLSKEKFPWMFTDEPTTVILRISLHREQGEPEILLQPVLIGSALKRQIQEYLGPGDA